jgi:tetratricopeptide (TPR) repeat protein
MNEMNILIVGTISFFLSGCSKEFLDYIGKTCGTYAETDPRYQQCMQYYGLTPQSSVPGGRPGQVMPRTETQTSVLPEFSDWVDSKHDSKKTDNKKNEDSKTQNKKGTSKEQKAVSQETHGDKSPVINDVGRDVNINYGTINYPAPEGIQAQLAELQKNVYEIRGELVDRNHRELEAKANAALSANNLDQAVQYIDAAISRNSSRPTHQLSDSELVVLAADYAQKGFIRQKQNLFGEAAEEFRAAADTVPRNERQLRLNYINAQATMLLFAGRIQEAQVVYERGIIEFERHLQTKEQILGDSGDAGFLLAHLLTLTDLYLTQSKMMMQGIDDLGAAADEDKARLVGISDKARVAIDKLFRLVSILKEINKEDLASAGDKFIAYVEGRAYWRLAQTYLIHNPNKALLFYATAVDRFNSAKPFPILPEITQWELVQAYKGRGELYLKAASLNISWRSSITDCVSPEVCAETNFRNALQEAEQLPQPMKDGVRGGIMLDLAATLSTGVFHDTRQIEAARLQKNGIELMETTYGKYNPIVHQAQINWAYVQARTGDITGARATIKTVLDAVKPLGGEPMALGWIHSIAATLKKEGYSHAATQILPEPSQASSPSIIPEREKGNFGERDKNRAESRKQLDGPERRSDEHPLLSLQDLRGPQAHNVLEAIEIQSLDDAMRSQLNVPAKATGVVVISVEPNSPAASAGLQRGDVIQELNHQSVKNVLDFGRAQTRIKRDEMAVLLLNRGGNNLFIAIEPR